ncbi:hypothetical protein BDP27DRAFT_1323809 [Rhodocollybia butyracea]|uniref:MICOS complex subunit mic19 n=1 Tax=Rhodocollybia butyracea TaxID=206335 RepID=A0A9P5PVZ4_9AGAR|nr:hypothetical protein BDP27DRAFT_1323809 [Rhodocollybia butyracea]
MVEVERLFFMGASQSSSSNSNGEVVFKTETPVQFSPTLVSQLADRQNASPVPTSERQSTLDDQIRAKIKDEVGKLRREEEAVQKQIHTALEKENLDRERDGAGELADGTDSGIGAVKSSAALMGDLEEIRGKIERFQVRKSLQDWPQVRESREKLVECYRSHKASSLECWKEVEGFKDSVRTLEKEYFKTLQ